MLWEIYGCKKYCFWQHGTKWAIEDGGRDVELVESGCLTSGWGVRRAPTCVYADNTNFFTNTKETKIFTRSLPPVHINNNVHTGGQIKRII